MSRPLHRERLGLPTSRQRALVLLALTNAYPNALHPIAELHAALGGRVPLHTMWNILSSLLHFELLRVVGTNDRSAGYVLTPPPRGFTQAVREIETEATRPLRDHETLLRGDAEKLGLKLPYRDLFHPALEQVTDGRCGAEDGRNEEEQG